MESTLQQNYNCQSHKPVSMDKEDRALLKACGEWLRSSSEWYELKVIERVMKTVARKTGWNTPCAFWGNTPLHAVCECGMDDLVELLLERGADINRCDIFLSSSLRNLSLLSKPGDGL